MENNNSVSVSEGEYLLCPWASSTVSTTDNYSFRSVISDACLVKVRLRIDQFLRRPKTSYSSMKLVFHNEDKSRHFPLPCGEEEQIFIAPLRSNLALQTESSAWKRDHKKEEETGEKNLVFLSLFPYLLYRMLFDGSFLEENNLTTIDAFSLLVVLNWHSGCYLFPCQDKRGGQKSLE